MGLDSVKAGIYVKRKKGRLGTGGTAKDCVMETLWFPHAEKDGFVEFLLVADSMDKVLNLREKVALTSMSKEYTLRENSEDLYRRLQASLRK